MAEVLRHEVDLLRPLRFELLRFPHQPLERLGAVLAPHEGNGAEGAGVVAALRDLEIADVRRISQELADAGMPRDGILDEPAAAQLGHEVVQIREAEEEIDLGNLRLQLLLVALHQASRGYDRFHAALGLELGGAEDRVDRFLLRGVDEAAGVDEDDVGIREVLGDDRAVAHQLAHQPLRVDRRLVAAERDDAELHPR